MSNQSNSSSPSPTPSPPSSSSSSSDYFSSIRSSFSMRSIYQFFRSQWIPASVDQLESAEKKLFLSLNNQNYLQYFTPIKINLNDYDKYNKSNNPLVINTVHFSEQYSRNNNNDNTTINSNNNNNNNNNNNTDNRNNNSSINNRFHPLSNNNSINGGERHATLLLHGYGAGLPLFIRNYDFLSRLFPSLYSIDWLGAGRSSRPPFTARGVDQTEEFFISSIESWRSAHNIDKLTLIGHSMGGYFSSIYSMRYPERIERLILVSPAGVPHYDPSYEKRLESRGIMFGLMMKFFRSLYTSGVTPHDFVRFLGPWGKRPVKGYVYNRFMTGMDESIGKKSKENQGEEEEIKQHDEEQIKKWSHQYTKNIQQQNQEEKILALDKETLTEYCYNNLALERSSERSLSELFRPPVFAYRPLIDRLPSVAIHHRFPVHFIYGRMDWMDANAGASVVDMINKGTGNNRSASIHLVDRAGHQLFVDNPNGFHAALLDAINGTKLSS